MIDKDMQQKLITAAKLATKNSYAPYSNFRVGAAILTSNDKIFTGVNIENRSYGLTVCAERNAVAKMIDDGEKEIKAAAIFAADSQVPIPPCGACRQVLSEFGSNIEIFYSCNEEEITATTISNLLPEDSLFELKKR
ncbi:MAG: cytidine deaminase [Spirochaetales bacterium]|nr:cytidine deaminase [Spirochaetales bacterium]